MGRVDKMEDYTCKLFREYQDQWSKYAETMEKGEDAVKASYNTIHYRTDNVLV